MCTYNRQHVRQDVNVSNIVVSTLFYNCMRTRFRLVRKTGKDCYHSYHLKQRCICNVLPTTWAAVQNWLRDAVICLFILRFQLAFVIQVLIAIFSSKIAGNAWNYFLQWPQNWHIHNVEILTILPYIFVDANE